jgi:HlyD family secretion protein
MKAEVRRRVLVMSVAAVVVAGLVYGFLPKPVPVDVVLAKRGPLRLTIEEEGRTRVQDRFVVSVPVAGYLKRIDLHVGDVVRQGQPVANLEPLRSTVLDPRSRAEASAAIEAAEAALDASKETSRAMSADAEYAREREVRMKNLASSGYIAQDELEQAVSERKKAEANRLAAEAAALAADAELKRARSALRYSAAERTGREGKAVQVRAPMTGKVLRLYRESEGVVGAGEPLLDVGDPHRLEVKIEVLSADAIKIGKGTTVLFERWGGAEPLVGTVRVVEPVGFTKVSSLGVEEQRVLVIADFDSPAEQWQGLGDGYRLDASFILWEGTAVLQVPASALFRKDGGWALFAVEKGRARLRDVVVGQRNGLAAEILKGIPEGTEIIAHPDDAFQDGSRVRAK